MVAIVRRTRELHGLLRIRIGVGAAVFSPSVSKIHIELGTARFAGNAGAKQFWKKYLPRLKYHNPSVPMSVTRTEDSPCQMTIHFTPPSSSTTDPTTPAPVETKVIPLLLRSRSEILDDVLALTKAKKVEPTPAETRQMNELNEELFAINELRKKNEIIWEEMQREKAILKQAMGGLGNDEPKRGRRKAE